MTIEILMPALSPTMSKTGGKIVKWHKKEQDKIEVGDVIAEIETDKAIMELESADEGVLAKILVSEGVSSVPVNQPIAVMLEEGEDGNALDNYISAYANNIKAKKGIEINLSISECSTLNSKKEEDTKVVSGDRVKISPLAKKIAQSEGIDITQLKGTGPHGRIIKADILEFLCKSTQVETYKRPEDIVIEVSNIRKVIAQRMIESKQNIPHFYLTVDCQVDNLISLKNEINSVDKNNKVTINDLIIKAAAFSIKKFPNINSSWIDSKIVKYSNVDISIAVALEDGLITPIVKNADKKGILSISKEVKNLVNRARSGKLKPDEFQGKGLTISNLGMFNIKSFSAIINPPQACIMAFGTSKKQPVIINEKIEIAEIMTVTLSADHRIVDGAMGAKFLNTFKDYVENPLVMLIEAA
ncbi:pyruvate dehydrogenase complex dihydrolipoamide acetyltransferase [Wolbachia endosymbiont of Cruorifilaria tuberocauda]|uniref:pyruvate dehydrogenase complex dihydrolipoamide acetyltransferase n=1 Tax=Wolbachia endosymbiont of Cruorifilaria tuberocauda TaxID=1812111 RepID=UPI00158B0D15|nr:pyruvate dehydrogenase complex dihydrolipoamide acetyltransferase [Wolbachia endosymbiont of Cruorifilaria tuberocauda]QKX01544.1 pyruvate dehydrogenase complex dihydrolipoamide acetyltransferase [Wolbachia endosymbiont of Cruorifilaria tuberocauda]